jgi:hypothetical protein
VKVSDEERRFMRHALGLDRDMKAMRNHYTAHSARDIAIGDALVAKKLARRAPQPETVRTVGFQITFAGFQAVCERGETLCESQFNLMQWREVLA